MCGSSDRNGPERGLAVRGLLRWTGLLLVLITASPRGASGQVISPGRLTSAHGELEGMANCTKCHELRHPGVSRELCLDCHQPLARGLREGRGLHSTFEEDDCAACHKEHLGEDFALIRFDSLAFDHADTGFELRGSHLDTRCRECHRGELIEAADVRELKSRRGALARTYLGLPVRCGSCHEDADPHGDQFGGRSCTDCHDEVTWEDAGLFTHESARYQLSGRHGELGCEGCHPDEPGVPGSRMVRYRPLRFQVCDACHQDPHAGAVEGACERCHTTEGWHRVDREEVVGGFDHSASAFPLRGRHADLGCERCHGRPPPSDQRIAVSYRPGTVGFAYPQPEHGRCGSCHLDYHGGDFRHALDGTECEECHSEEGWIPAGYGIERHNREAAFELTGAHLSTPCVACHLAVEGEQEVRRLVLDKPLCVDCHRQDDPHGGRYGEFPCTACHDTDAFDLVSFRHEVTGAEANGPECHSCHEEDDPHAGQFGDRVCGECHGTETFSVAFDHTRTRFPLDGSHRDVPCAGCHPEVEIPDGRVTVRYRPLGTECTDCHGASR